MIHIRDAHIGAEPILEAIKKGRPNPFFVAK